jgi:hypothetical protein
MSTATDATARTRWPRHWRRIYWTQATARSGPHPTEKFNLKEFLKKVREGSPDKGMQAWDKLLDDKQITQLYAYVRARADKVLPPGRPDEVGPNAGPWVPPEGWPKEK